MPKYTPAELSRMKAEKELRDSQQQELLMAKRRQEEMARQRILGEQQQQRMQVVPPNMVGCHILKESICGSTISRDSNKHKYFSNSSNNNNNSSSSSSSSNTNNNSSSSNRLLALHDPQESAFLLFKGCPKSELKSTSLSSKGSLLQCPRQMLACLLSS
jgi:hypothetical protein